MTIIETILGGLILTVMTALITKLLAKRNIITQAECGKNQLACVSLVNLKLQHIGESLSRLEHGQEVLLELLTNKKDD